MIIKFTLIFRIYKYKFGWEHHKYSILEYKDLHICSELNNLEADINY